MNDKGSLFDRNHPDVVKSLQTEYPGFRLQCLECGSFAVGLDSDVGYSDTSGMWGGVQFKCASCGKGETVIYPK